MTTQPEATGIESVLAAHQRITAQPGGPCWCGKWPTADHDETWMTHVAAVLNEQIVAAQAEAWSKGWQARRASVTTGHAQTNPYRAALVAPAREGEE